MIYDAFTKLQDTLTQTHPDRRRSRTDQALSESVDQLYQTVVHSIHCMVVWLNYEERKTWTKISARFKRRNGPTPTSPEEILQKLEEQIKEFRRALDLARDRAIETTQLMSHATGIQTVMVREEVMATRTIQTV
ncbi:hypothetical protein VTI74DRAFT_8708 [Chaetomium olivicolor]